MRTKDEGGRRLSPVRLLEMLEWRFGVFEALAYASLELADKAGEDDDCPPMDRRTAEAVLEFGDDVRRAYRSAAKWIETRAPIPTTRTP